ncbi:homogentisate 1,2-dioxygenase [Paenibacillus cremeus]
MSFYHRLGQIPAKRHTQFHKPDGQLYREQVMGTKGFSGIQSILYHHHAPTELLQVQLLNDCEPEYEDKGALRHRHFRTNQYQGTGDAITGRQYLLGNEDLLIGVMTPTEPMNYYFRNANGDELLFVHHGSGKLETIFGTLPYKPGDYIVLPVGTIYRLVPNSGRTTLLFLETSSWITTPKRYRNEHGQLLEHSPYCERDLRVPEKLETYTVQGKHEVRTKKGSQMHSHVLNHHPLDVVGWDGYLYPWIFNIGDFEPITGRVHMPPPIHQTFEGSNFVVCSFCPRLLDYHPQSIPAPYYHSNVDSDEVLYYVDGNFGSRRGIEEGSITLHPSGIPHGPHPGKVEESIGKKHTQELAVMIDTFRPLRVVKQAHAIEDHDYAYSWA